MVPAPGALGADDADASALVGGVAEAVGEAGFELGEAVEAFAGGVRHSGDHGGHDLIFPAGDGGGEAGDLGDLLVLRAPIVEGEQLVERYRFAPARRVCIPKKNGKLRPLGLPSWPDKLVGEVVRLLLEAYYEPRFSGRSHGFRKGRRCHTALREIHNTWTGTTWFIEGDISDCFGSLDHEVLLGILAEKSATSGSCGLSAVC
jgi:hypothetical protein